MIKLHKRKHRRGNELSIEQEHFGKRTKIFSSSLDYRRKKNDKKIVRMHMHIVRK